MENEKIDPGPMPPESPIMKYFTYDHLKASELDGQMGPRESSKMICELAEFMEINIPNGPEKSAGLRKLLEAKDCLVRAVL